MKLSYQVCNFLEKNIDLKKIKYFDTISSDNFDVLDGKVECIFNNHIFNDIHNINSFITNINKKIINGGYYIGYGETLKQRQIRIKNKYNIFLAKFFFPIDFLYKRIFPKIPGLKNIYFLLNRHKNKVLSKTEIIGRFVAGGFKIKKYKEINNKLYFIVQRISEPNFSPNSSYGLILHSNRIGKNGKIIKMYKIRTMHPYSEYLQANIIDNNKLSDTGKINNDYRITGWGAFLRRYWLDEIPNLINLFKGDVKLIGIRPISFDYYKRLPDNLKKKRIQTKPACIGIHYCIIPKKPSDVFKIEIDYLNQYFKRPFITDLIYLKKFFLNIIFNRIRSI